MTHCIGGLAALPPLAPLPPRAPAETVGVAYTVLGVEPARDRGVLIGLAVVEMDIAGVVIVLQGVRVLRRADGGRECAAPVFRHPVSGAWLPGVVLPPELSAALAAEVLVSSKGVVQ